MRRLPLWLFLLAAVLFSLPLVSRAGDDDGDERSEGHGAARAASASLPDSPALATYREECGACHLAYPPGLLPARSWERLLSGLGEHFGQNAELDAPTQATLARWLADNAAEALSHPKSRRALRSAGSGTPLRLSELPWLRHEHDEVAPRVWARPAVASRANCPACHPDAERWSFDEDRARIPR